MPTIEDRVKNVVSQLLKVDAAQIKNEDKFTTDLGAESVQSIELVAMFEEEFGIEMDEQASLAIDTVGGAVDFITTTCREQGAEV